MTKIELRSAMKRAILDQVLKMLDLAFGDYSEEDPSDEERQACQTILASWERTKNAQELTGD